jgi:hypothetical protein
MKRIIFDTSVWIDYLKGKQDDFTGCLHEYLVNDHPLMLTPTVIQEILQGIKHDTQYPIIKRLLLDIDILVIDAIDAATGAAELYRSLRTRGITIKSTDCLIAYYAICFELELAHHDKDFDSIARHTKLKIWKP